MLSSHGRVVRLYHHFTNTQANPIKPVWTNRCYSAPGRKTNGFRFILFISIDNGIYILFRTELHL